MATKRRHRRVPWNKGKIVGQKAPLKLREIWPSIQSFAPATFWGSASATLHMKVTSTRVPS